MIARESRTQAALRLLGCLAFVAVGGWMLSIAPSEPRWTIRMTMGGYLGVLFFGVIALRYAWSVLKPGTLEVSTTGISQDLGWRKTHWRWADVEKVELRRTAADRVSVCLLYPNGRAPVRLFGWNVSAEQLFNTIERTRRSYSNSTMI
jgi:hypothetical protein